MGLHPQMGPLPVISDVTLLPNLTTFTRPQLGVYRTCTITWCSICINLLDIVGKSIKLNHKLLYSEFKSTFAFPPGL